MTTTDLFDEELKQRPEEKQKTAKPIPTEALRIRDAWRKCRTRHGCDVDRIDATLSDGGRGIRNLCALHSREHLSWEWLRDAAANYWGDLEEREPFPKVFNFGNFFGRDRYFEDFLPTEKATE